MSLTDRTAQTFTLPDGRTLGFGEWGDAGGRPVLFFHGTPGSRILTAVFDEPARAHGLRLIGVDRPGYGLSDIHEGRSVLDFVGDVGALLESLAIDGFGVMGASGGGPYVLACAHHLAERVQGALVMCGIGPPECWDPALRAALEQSRADPAASEAQLQQAVASVAADRSLIVQSILQNVPSTMKAVAESNPALIEAYIDHTAEAFRHGTAGTTLEQRLIPEPWGFDIADIGVPVAIWCGGQDVLLPHARWMADRIPGATIRVDEEAGHIDGLWLGPELVDLLLERMGAA